ncbi:hypothetical protein [Hoeflea olei]|uniref:Uncharacterized protein n=1 Tax=Hoeflea olei TaxID=1480615 RepID=A0A1C1YY72_9HYPH|nr:hypothetical protein [Hoeflea olei]OCW58514.1 hypothetical protein AWJ14_18650 [Hoeflea olei]
MTTLITRLYETPERASAVAAALAAHEFRDKHYDVIAAPQSEEGPTVGALDAIHQALSKAGVIPRSAAVYAPLILEGNALVVVRAPMGTAFDVEAIVDSFESLDAGVRDEVHLPAEAGLPPKVYRQRATSLLPRDAMILSGRKFLPAITSRDTSPWSGLVTSGPWAGLVTGNTTPFSSTLGLPTLTKTNA